MTEPLSEKQAAAIIRRVNSAGAEPGFEFKSAGFIGPRLGAPQCFEIGIRPNGTTPLDKMHFVCVPFGSDKPTQAGLDYAVSLALDGLTLWARHRLRKLATT